jgi:hypothetical protein
VKLLGEHAMALNTNNKTKGIPSAFGTGTLPNSASHEYFITIKWSFCETRKAF